MNLTLPVIAVLLAIGLGAEEKKPAKISPPGPENTVGMGVQPPTVEALKDENERLKAQVEVLQELFSNEQAACWSLDLMQSRYKAALAQKKLADLIAKQKATAPKEAPK